MEEGRQEEVKTMGEPVDRISRLIGQGMLDEGLLTPEQLTLLLGAQPKRGQRLGEVAVELGMVEGSRLAEFLAKFFNLPYLKLQEDQEFDPSAAELIPETLARRYVVIVVRREGNGLTVAMADPLDVRAIDAVRLETKCRIKKAVASRSAILRSIDRVYHASSRIASSMDQLFDSDSVETEDASGVQVEQLKYEASDAPVIQFVNLLLMRAIQERASDIHIEPEERSVTIRLRVDGQLREVSAPPRQMLRAITTRIKLLGNLDIAERRLPQDGRFKFKVFDKTIDVRLSSLPTAFGEKLVLRILDRGSLILDMESLGFEPKMLDVFRRTLQLPHGLIILTGPTGSGKTTTLYAALNAIKSPTKNIVTVEDPIEYQIGKINQVQAKPGIGLTFAAGLRAILRQDPDIVMVGEIRDRETAEICIRAALTGHLVLSTLHTNDAISAISRLTDVGIETYLVTASLTLVMAQRLLRRICDGCAADWEPPIELMQRLRVAGGIAIGETLKFRQGAGCKHCGQTGYFSRVAVYEQFIFNDRVKALVAAGATIGELREEAVRGGFQTLLQSALNKVRVGVTTLEEALSVCATQSEMVE